MKKMTDFFCESAFFALVISLFGYELGNFLKKKTKLPLFHPLLISILVVIAILVLFGIDYRVYEDGAKILNYLLTPSMVALAVPLYRQLEILKKNSLAISVGILSGVAASLILTVFMAAVFGLTHSEYVTFLPKSITTAIGMAMSEELGGSATITVAIIIITGIAGNMTGDLICKIFKIEDRIAVGLALGTSAHAIGTARAMELGEIEGAMSSLAVVVAGLLTVAGANIFALFY